ncbi:MAG: ribokinase [archaeon GW2011_AR5]|nr:MAG: ribokinase [archaeon GW2011_AR5]
MGRVVCIGSANVDISLFVDKLGTGDSEHGVSSTNVCSGGSAANIASGLGRLGNQVSFFGNLGSDNYTEMLERDFDKDGVDYSSAVRTGKPNNTCYVFIDASGRRQMYAYNNVGFSAADFPEHLENSDFVIFTSLVKDGIVDVYSEIAGRARKRGAKIMFVPGSILARLGFRELKRFLVHCDYVILNAAELGMIGNILLTAVPKVIVTDGGNSVRFFNCGSVREFPVNAVKAVDTTGAGDCFAAAFVSALSDGKPENDAIRFAASAASMSVLEKGPRAMPVMNNKRL